jgi:hypothetical protein
MDQGAIEGEMDGASNSMDQGASDGGKKFGSG